MKVAHTSSLSCPMNPLLRVVTGRWTTTILWHLSNEGPLRFGALMGLIPEISAKVLTERLKMLETNGIILRKQKATIPPAVSYEMTEHGRDLHRALRSLHDVALKWDAAGWAPGEGFPTPPATQAAE